MTGPGQDEEEDGVRPASSVVVKKFWPDDMPPLIRLMLEEDLRMFGAAYYIKTGRAYTVVPSEQLTIVRLETWERNTKEDER